MKNYIQFFSLLLLSVLLFDCTEKKEVLSNLPQYVPTYEVKYSVKNAFDGYIMIRKTESPGVQLLINNEGKVVWYAATSSTLFRPFTPYEESFVSLHSDQLALDLSYTGDTLNTWDISRDTATGYTFHHEALKTDDGSLVTLTKKYVESDLSTDEPDARKGYIKNEGIVKLSPDGNVSFEWSLDRRRDDYGQLLTDEARGWGHANAILHDRDCNYLISWKGYNQIWKIDGSTGEVLWKYDGYRGARDTVGIVGQHAITTDLAGNYLVFDNGRKISRAHSFTVNADGTFDTKYDIALPDSLFSSKQGSVYQFEEDRFLFCSSQTKSLIVTNKKGEILWLAEGNYVSYRAHYIPREQVK